MIIQIHQQISQNHQFPLFFIYIVLLFHLLSFIKAKEESYEFICNITKLIKQSSNGEIYCFYILRNSSLILKCEKASIILLVQQTEGKLLASSSYD